HPLRPWGVPPLTSDSFYLSVNGRSHRTHTYPVPELLCHRSTLTPPNAPAHFPGVASFPVTVRTPCSDHTSGSDRFPVPARSLCSVLLPGSVPPVPAASDSC